MKSLIFILIFLGFISLNAKTIIRGKVSSKGEALIGANISIKDSYDGASSKAEGRFEFKTNKKGKAILLVKLIGYENHESELVLNDSIVELNIKLKEKAYRTDAVSVSAGAFEAGDEKKATVFSSLDIATTAGSGADIVSAFTTLPGVSIVGEGEGLYVRGGEGRETAIVIDGLEVKHPFYSKIPNIGTRGRFSPFFFKGTYFSTGGYSAEYGNGLSSAMIINSIDLPQYSFTHVDLMPLGIGFGHTHLGDNYSIGADVNYSNLKWYFDINPQDTKWNKAPEGLDAVVNFRVKTSETGMLKFITYMAKDNSNMEFDSYSAKGVRNQKYDLGNENIISNLSYKELFSEAWLITAALSIGVNTDRANYEANENGNIIKSNSSSYDKQLMAKLKVTNFFGDYSSLNYGAEFTNYHYDGVFFPNTFDIVSGKANFNYYSLFLEPEFGITKDFTIRPGIRFENNGLNEKSKYSPRISAAYRLTEHSQLSAAYGKYYQMTAPAYFVYDNTLDFEAASHYILSYQLMTGQRTFRSEVYYKKYDNLMLNSSSQLDNPLYSTSGYGDAKGFEFFWRDKETFKLFDYWLSYSFLDSKRKFDDYREELFPDFASKHTFSAVMKKYFESINTNLSFTYSYASGRNYYYNPAQGSQTLKYQAPDYHNFSMSLTYLTNLFGSFTVFVFSVDNILGINNTFTYRQISETEKIAVKPQSLRNVFFGVFLSFGRDNSEDF